MNQVFFGLIWPMWLLLLGSLLTIAQPNEKSSPSVTSVHCPPVIAALAFSYDEQNKPSLAYDTEPRTKFGYDVPLMHAKGERGIWSAGGCALLVDLANGLAAKTGANLADNVADAARLRNQLASQEIAGGHAFGKHVVKEGQFPGITTPQQFGSHIENIMGNPSAVRNLSNGRVAYWDNASGTVVIRNPGAIDGGTAFKPTQGKTYFDNLK